MQLCRISTAVKTLYIALFLSLFSLNLYAEASADAEKEASAGPGQEAYTKAQAAWEKGEWESALGLCEEALKINRRFKEAWLLKGQITWQMKDYKTALGSFEEYLRLDPKNTLVWVNRGQCLFELERYKDMQESFDKAQSIDPKYPPLYMNMGMDYLNMGNYEDAYHAFQKLEELGEKSTYFSWTKRVLQITNESFAPPQDWNVNLDSYQTVLDLTDSTKAKYLVNLTSVTGTAIKFAGSREQPFSYAPNFDIWDGAMIFDKRGDGLLANGTHFRYKKITGDTMTIEEGQIENWRLSLSSKKCFLLSQ
jgi:tetratricopeptide (TPR) repeat protein